MLRKRAAFTLIEVMVVLSILAIIAILAYNFFGSTMRDAVLERNVTKVFNDMRTIADASEQYTLENGQPFYTAWPLTSKKLSLVTELTNGGHLKSLPTPPGDLTAWGGMEHEYYIFNNSDMDASGNRDAFIAAYLNVGTAFCKKFNGKYNAVGENTTNALVDAIGSPAVCNGSNEDSNIIRFVIEKDYQ